MFDGLSRRHWRHGPVSLWRRDRVLKFGTDQSSLDSSSRLATKPFASGLEPMAPHWLTLAERHPEEDLEGKAGLDRRVAVGLLTAATPRRNGFP